MTTLQDTIRIHHDTCILDASSEPRWINKRYARNTLRIHSGYVSWARSICPAAHKELKSLRLFVAGVGLHLGLALKGWHRAGTGAFRLFPPMSPTFFFKVFV